MTEGTQEKEDCPVCRNSVGVRMALDICMDLDGVNCEELKAKVTSEEITMEDLMGTLKEAAAKSPGNKVELLEELEFLMKGEEDVRDD